jgi:hypothetical protein
MSDTSLTSKGLTLGLIILALALLYPGITQPVMTLSGAVENARIAELSIDVITEQDPGSQTGQMLRSMSRLLGLDQIEGQMQVYSTTRSIWGTAQALAESGYLAVGLLIIFFSVLIPVFKLLLQAALLFVSGEALRLPLLNLNAALSKWSMADVFVMALLVAFLAGGAAKQSGDILIMQASLGPGFYYFLAYCLFSIAAGIAMKRQLSSQVQSRPGVSAG